MKDSTSSADLVALIQDLCRETGYVTHGQALEIAHKLAAALAVEARCESCPWAGGCLNCPDRALAVEEPKPPAEPTPYPGPANAKTGPEVLATWKYKK